MKKLNRDIIFCDTVSNRYLYFCLSEEYRYRLYMYFHQYSISRHACVSQNKRQWYFAMLHGWLQNNVPQEKLELIYTVFTFEYILTQWTVNLLKIWMFVLWNMLLGIYVVFIFTEASDECFNFCFCKIYVKLISWHWSIWGCKYCRKTYSEIGQFHYNQGDRVGSSLSVYATVRS